MISNICDSILELNDLEKSITDIKEFNLHIDPKLKLYLDILKEKYGVL